jgi:hypothetical protein
MLPASRQVYVVQEQPPANITRRRVDAKVYCFVNNVQRDLLYVEFKRARFPDAQRAEAEAQVIGYCQTLLGADPNMRSISAMLCIGTQVAIWRVYRTTQAPVGARFDDVNSHTGSLKVRRLFSGIRTTYGR